MQAPAAERPQGILLEPVSAAGLPRVAEAAVAAGIAWLVSNAQVDYLGTLRRNAKAPVFQVSQDHVEVGRIQGRQMGAILPEGGTVLYLRGPSMSSIASRRFEGLDSAKPKNVDVKSVKVQGSTAESAYTAVCSWLNLSTVKPEGTRVIASQNADFIFGARKAFETTKDAERKKWLALPCAGVGIQSRSSRWWIRNVSCGGADIPDDGYRARNAGAGDERRFAADGKNICGGAVVSEPGRTRQEKAPGLAAFAWFRGVAKPASRQAR